jgi:hypothetical protein
VILVTACDGSGAGISDRETALIDAVGIAIHEELCSGCTLLWSADVSYHEAAKAAIAAYREAEADHA